MKPASVYIQKKYISLIGPRLRNFKFRNQKIANFCCPYCGDSKTNKRKARGYLFLPKGKWASRGYLFVCKNCDASRPFDAFLSEQDANLHQEYVLETMSETTGTQTGTKDDFAWAKKPAPIFIKKKPSLLIPCSSLPADHPAVNYLASRMVPTAHVYWAESFHDACYVECPSLADSETFVPNEPRICFQLKDHTGKLFGLVGRDITGLAKSKYLTVKFDPEVPKVYGLERHQRDKPTIVVEGPIDSLFLPNAVAMCGGSLSFDVLDSMFDPNKTFYALDNEPRKKETVQKMKKFITHGYWVTIWKHIPSNLKDINQMILAGMGRQTILQNIADCSFRGPQAVLELNMWAKI